ncbi:hypothetical protein [Arthrobacter methylotrophus]|uniref:hypothetical protein n=1 Tax=Arthrobacter methylotrophus TaxID=121291 RepID=UPI0031EFD231
MTARIRGGAPAARPDGGVVAAHVFELRVERPVDAANVLGFASAFRRHARWPVMSIITSVGTSVRESTYDASMAKITASAIGTNR